VQHELQQQVIPLKTIFMKRISIYLGLMSVLALGATGCYKDIVSPESDPDGPPQQVSFKQDVAPLLQAKCASCHSASAGASAHKPYMDSTVAYTNLVNGGFVNTLIPKQSILYQAVYGTMSEYMPASKDKSKVYDWIRIGAPNN
jgi:hypothetical protein